MRTETITREIYTFDELDDRTKANVLDDWRNDTTEYAWSDEWIESLNAFADDTGMGIDDYSLSPYAYSYVKWSFELDDIDKSELTGLRLRTWLVNNWVGGWTTGKYYHKGRKGRHSKCQFEVSCPFTGVISDCTLMEPVLAFIAKPDDRSLKDVIEECFDAFVKGYQEDMAAQDRDDYIIDTIEANGYEFYATGSMV